MTRTRLARAALMLGTILAGAMQVAAPLAAETVAIGIGTQDTTTNTVTTGIVIRKLGLLEKHLPHDGKYADTKYEVSWSNFTSGPPITNGMMADKLQIGGMGDYPLIINGFTSAKDPGARSQLIAVAAYNLAGSGNAVMVNKASSFFTLKDLKDKVVSVPFGSAAHGMVLRAMAEQGLAPDYFRLVSQSPEVGSTNLQEQKIDAHADFVPYGELLPHRGFARKIYDGVQTGLPTFHGVVVRSDFAKAHPEVVDAYLQAVLDADEWVRSDPKAASEKIAEWTGTDKEVVYIFLGPGGIMTLDPTIKPQLVDAARADVKVLQGLGRMKEFDVAPWVDDGPLRKAFAERGLDYDAQLRATANNEVRGRDEFCNVDVVKPREAGEIWIKGGAIKPYSSTACTLGAYAAMQAAGKAIDVAYLFDHARGIKLFAPEAFYAVAGREAVPFLLKGDAEAYAAKSGGKVVSFDEALKSVVPRG